MFPYTKIVSLIHDEVCDIVQQFDKLHWSPSSAHERSVSHCVRQCGMSAKVVGVMVGVTVPVVANEQTDLILKLSFLSVWRLLGVRD